MAGRGPQTFKKRQKEQLRKEKQEEKVARRLLRKQNKELGIIDPSDDPDEFLAEMRAEMEGGLDGDDLPDVDSPVPAASKDAQPA